MSLMPLSNPFRYLLFGDVFDTILPDFILAFTFFTALVYAVLSRRFGRQRPAIAMSVSLGTALAVGLAWWEYTKGISVRELGPVAVGFAVIMLAAVIYRSIRGVGGSWAGAGIALGASLLVGWTLGLDWPVDQEVIQTLVMVTLTVGILAFLLHRRTGLIQAQPAWKGVDSARYDMRDLNDDRRMARSLRKRFQHLRHEAHHLHEHPEEAQNIMLQLRRMLPAEGWLTERMARLREKAHHARQGHAARIRELETEIAKLPAEARAKAARELAARYNELNLDRRLERLDKAVAENERRIRKLTRQAEADLQACDYKALVGVLEAASKLQRHNARLFRLIDRTEARLLAAARQAARQARI